MFYFPLMWMVCGGPKQGEGDWWGVTSYSWSYLGDKQLELQGSNAMAIGDKQIELQRHKEGVVTWIFVRLKDKKEGEL